MTVTNRKFLFAHRVSAAVFSLLIVITGVFAAVPPEVLACVGSGSVTISIDQTLTNTRGTNCDFRGGGNRTGSGSYQIVHECYYSGSHTWGDPRNNNATATPKYDNSVLSLSLEEHSRFNVPHWIWAWEQRINSSEYTFGELANLQSLYWRNKRADLLAAALQIRSSTPSNASSWRLVFTSPSARDDILDGPHGPQLSTTSAPVFTGPGYLPGDATVSVAGIRLSHTPTSINARVWNWGDTPQLPVAYNGTTAAAQMFVATYDEIGSMIGISSLAMMSSSPTQSMYALLWPSRSAMWGTQYVDSRVETARSWSWWTPQFPSRVWVETGAGTNSYTWTGYWTFVYRYENGLYEDGTRYNVEVFFPNARPYYTREQVAAGFEAVVRAQVNVQWNQAPVASGGSSLRGSYYVPIAAAGPDCASDSFNILGIPLGSGPGNCDALGMRSDATAASRISADCRLFWHYRREEPPALSTTDFNNIMGQMYSRMEFRPDSAAAVVGEPVTFRLSRAPRSRGIHILNRMAADSSINIDAYINQVGVTVYLGTSSTPVRIIPRATQNATEYTFTYTFTQTPASRLQEPECAATRNATELLNVCGIRFDSNGEPQYVLTFRTWWDGMYRYTGGGVSSSYRGLFTTAHATMSTAVRNQTTPWVDGWGFNRNVYNASGGDISGPWPLYGRTSPDSYGTPMYHNADFTLNIPVLQVQPGRNE